MKTGLHPARHARLGALLRRAREAESLTQTELAMRLGVPQSLVSNYELGERRLDLAELEDICEALGLNVTELLGRYFDGGSAEA